MTKIAILGLGYVGMPLFTAFGDKFDTVGFDENPQKIAKIIKIHPEFAEKISNDVQILKSANFFIVTVPTPLDSAQNPDLTHVLKASETIARVLKRGDIVVYESTVFPTCTRKICIPVLEKSGLRLGDFIVAYSPERVNPGDAVHTLQNIVKIVGASADPERVAAVYRQIISRVVTVQSIEIAEAAKILENTQRNVNIALINEMTRVFGALGVPIQPVLRAASTKWNFLNFSPGLIGGHCIAIDPHYLLHIARAHGEEPQILNAALLVNEKMPDFVVKIFLSKLTQNGLDPMKTRVAIFGATFKENCDDVRNAKIFDVFFALRRAKICAQIFDPIADAEDVRALYGVQIAGLPDGTKIFDACIIGVAHEIFKTLNFREFLAPKSVIFDVKSILDPKGLPEFHVFSL